MTAQHEEIEDTFPHPLDCHLCGATTAPPATACEACGAALRVTAPIAPNTVLGSYRLMYVLGEGGMGVVYLAEHTRLGRRVAVKVLRSEYSNNTQAVHRFFAEARAVNKICHQNIVEITDFVENPSGDNYYIMELLQGSSLASAIDGQPLLPLARSVGIMTQVARALEAVHEAGIVHRDLKPDNVFLIERSGQKDFVKLLDFGVAKLGEHNDGIPVHRTAAGTILGTPEYMSPEQASGKSVDFRTDIYAFGVMLYELATGVLPLTGTSFGELVVKHLTVTPTRPTRIPDLPHTIPATLEDLILACLAKEPADRPDDIRTVVTRLEAIAEAEGWSLVTFSESLRTTGVIAMPKLHKPRVAPAAEPAALDDDEVPRKRRVGLIAVIGAVIAVALALVAWRLSGAHPPSEQVAKKKVVPDKIRIEFATTPAGADVFRADETVALGRTPFTAEFEPSDRIEAFEIRLAGHDAAIERVRLDRPSKINVSLTATAAPEPVAADPHEATAVPHETAGKPSRTPPPRPPVTVHKPAHNPAATGSGSKPIDRSGVMNPFEKR